MNEIKEVDFSHFDEEQETLVGETSGGDQSIIPENKISVAKFYKSKYFKIGIIVVMVSATILVLVLNRLKSNAPVVAPGTLPPGINLPPDVLPLPSMPQ